VPLVYSMEMADSPKLIAFHLWWVFSSLDKFTHPFQFSKHLQFMCILGRDLIVISLTLQRQFEMESALVPQGSYVFIALLVLLAVFDICIAIQNLSLSGE
jgi:hypothetical protein